MSSEHESRLKRKAENQAQKENSKLAKIDPELREEKSLTKEELKGKRKKEKLSRTNPITPATGSTQKVGANRERMEGFAKTVGEDDIGTAEERANVGQGQFNPHVTKYDAPNIDPRGQNFVDKSLTLVGHWQSEKGDGQTVWKSGKNINGKNALFGKYFKHSGQKGWTKMNLNKRRNYFQKHTIANQNPYAYQNGTRFISMIDHENKLKEKDIVEGKKGAEIVAEEAFRSKTRM